MFFSVT
jgi:hypothetical protein